MAVYIISFGATAWHPTDYEYVMACAWRIRLGELPYRDFIYHKPPLTPYLHAVWQLFPGGWGIRASRLVFFAQLAASGAAPILWVASQRRVALGWRLPLLGVTFTVFALHNFPAMPWQTSDGIFFCALGVVGLLDSLVTPSPRRAFTARALSSVFFSLAILSKQSYAPGAFALAVCSAVEVALGFLRPTPQKSLALALRLLAAGAGPGLLIFGSTLLWLVLTQALPHFLAQFHSQSSGAALLHHGWEILWASPHVWTCVPWALFPLLRVLDSAQSRWRFWACRIFALVALAAVAKVARERAGEGFDNLGQLVFFMIVGAFLGRLALWGVVRLRRGTGIGSVTDPVMIGAHLGLLGIAWCTQLSLGYHTPILGVAGLGLVFHELLPVERSTLLDLLPVVVLTAVVGEVFWQLNEANPYRDQQRTLLTQDLGEISPRLEGMQTNQATFDRYVELKALVQRYSVEGHRSFAVLFNYPGAHWIFEQKSPYGLDWNYPPEPDGFEEGLWRQLVDHNAIAFIPKEVAARWGPEEAQPPPACSSIDYSGHSLLSAWAATRWKLLAEGRYFCLYSQ